MLASHVSTSRRSRCCKYPVIGSISVPESEAMVSRGYISSDGDALYGGRFRLSFPLRPQLNSLCRLNDPLAALSDGSPSNYGPFTSPCDSIKPLVSNRVSSLFPTPCHRRV